VADIDFATSARIQPWPTLAQGTPDRPGQDAGVTAALDVVVVAGHPATAGAATALSLALAVVAPPNPTAPAASRLSAAAAARRLILTVRGIEKVPIASLRQ
jgi:hypothetical protein